MGTAPAPHTSPTAPEDRDWQWSGTNKLDEHGGWGAVANAHAWYDDNADDHDPPHQKTAYKLPHHELIDGRLHVVWDGVNSAMNVLVGGRGGTDIPDGDRKAVYEHLARHYEEFDKSPPELRS